MLDALHADFAQLMARFSEPYLRYLHQSFIRDEKLSGLLGPRGVGKTTFLLQLIQATPDFLRRALYLSLDSIHASDIQLYALADQFQKTGGRLLVLDEIHRYPDFERELKAIHDAFDLQVIFSGSSALHLEHSKADLSRRAVMYRMNGLSFREYLELVTSETFSPRPLADILAHHETLCQEINRRIKPLEHFADYLKYGYFPYFRESLETYHGKLRQTLALCIDLDIALLFGVDRDKLNALKKLLLLLCQSVPNQINISKLSAAIGSSRNTTYTYLHYLEQAGILRSIWGAGRNAAVMSKPEKLYLANPNNAHALCPSPLVGTQREIFFASQLAHAHELRHPGQGGDFLVDDRWLFEIGGTGKTRHQIRGREDAYLVIDDIEHGQGTRIPLWLFGFLY
ncbi:MAG: AAA family ATPase [Rhodocyclaceae bacterium]|nr:AAA family ATPase [Rhodocyclaceae bacterium]